MSNSLRSYGWSLACALHWRVYTYRGVDSADNSAVMQCDASQGLTNHIIARSSFLCQPLQQFGDCACSNTAHVHSVLRTCFCRLTALLMTGSWDDKINQIRSVFLPSSCNSASGTFPSCRRPQPPCEPKQPHWHLFNKPGELLKLVTSLSFVL